jgi:hypothetical protein
MNSNGFQRRGRLTCMVYSGSFFGVSAQLIPVLFLAMVVEEKLQPDSEGTPSERVGRSWLFVSLVIGELVALSVIAGGLSPSRVSVASSLCRCCSQHSSWHCRSSVAS